MYQQINMYQPVFRRQRKIFSAATLLKIVAMAAVLLLALYAHARWTLNGLQHEHLRQLRQRILFSYRLKPLEPAALAVYLQHHPLVVVIAAYRCSARGR